jgi:hypothetical protein
VVLVAGIPALLVLALPCAAAVRYGWRANRVQDRRAVVPMVLGAAIVVWFTVLTVLGAVAGPV